MSQTPKVGLIEIKVLHVAVTKALLHVTISDTVSICLRMRAWVSRIQARSDRLKHHCQLYLASASSFTEDQFGTRRYIRQILSHVATRLIFEGLQTN